MTEKHQNNEKRLSKAKKFVIKFIKSCLKIKDKKVINKKIKRKSLKTHSSCDFQRQVRDEAVEAAAGKLIIKQDKQSQLFVAETEYQAALVVAAAAQIELDDCENT